MLRRRSGRTKFENRSLDLTEVTLIDVEVVQFLLRCELEGIRLVGCPA